MDEIIDQPDRGELGHVEREGFLPDNQDYLLGPGDRQHPEYQDPDPDLLFPAVEPRQDLERVGHLQDNHHHPQAQEHVVLDQAQFGEYHGRDIELHDIHAGECSLARPNLTCFFNLKNCSPFELVIMKFTFFFVYLFLILLLFNFNSGFFPGQDGEQQGQLQEGALGDLQDIGEYMGLDDDEFGEYLGQPEEAQAQEDLGGHGLDVPVEAQAHGEVPHLDVHDVPQEAPAHVDQQDFGDHGIDAG